MLGLRFAFLPFVVLAATGLAVPARGQVAATAPCRLCSATPDDSNNARPSTPLRLEVETRLDFDKIVFDGRGTAVLALSPGGATRLSGATAAGARAMPGAVVIRGEPGRAVRIDLPSQVNLLGEGSGSIRIDSLVTDLSSFPRIGDDGTLSFRFGGDLRLSGDNEGAYRGTIDITVEYL